MADNRKTVSELWEEKTGLSWSEARKRGLSDGSMSSNLKLMKLLQEESPNSDIPLKDPIHDFGEIEGVTVKVARNKRVNQQHSKVKSGGDDYTSGLPYAIVDKPNNRMYLYDEDHVMLGGENVITGADNLDKDLAPGSRDWIRLQDELGYDDKKMVEYIQYLKDTNQRITPEGEFTVGQVKDEIYKDQSRIGRFINMFRPGRRKEIEEKRKQTYGEKGKLLTLVDAQGVDSSKAVHGTGYEDRVEALKSDVKDAYKRDMSSGCINVGGESICFDTLEKGSKMFILGDETEDLVQTTKGSNKFSKNIHKVDSESRVLREILKERGIDVSEDEAEKLAIIENIESRSGADTKLGTLDYVADNLGVAKSRGSFQINTSPKAFGSYLPKDYNWRDRGDQAEAVLKFIRQNSQAVDGDIESLYRLYNSGTLNSTETKNLNKVRGFKRILQNNDLD